MSFIADKQTLQDLNLLGKYKQNSIYSLFNKVKTSGGERLLEEMFNHPLTEALAINHRSSIFKYFQVRNLQFPFQRDTFNVVENYLSMAAAGNPVVSIVSLFTKKISGPLLRDDQFQIIHNEVLTSIDALNTLRIFLNILPEEIGNPFWEQLKISKAILSDERLSWLSKWEREEHLSVLKLAKYDHLLRHTFRKEMAMLLEIVYQLDIYISVSNIARVSKFSYAVALPKDKNEYYTKALRHPGIENAVANPLSFNTTRNLLFLTGVNMAGKSTFMKAFGISIYLAHMGFPVAADEMIFSVKDGLYSSINVPDNLNLGLSHFYAEVLRVKKVAVEVASGKNLLVIFDELFKGTNVMDAYDATLAVTGSFSKYRGCFFIISTHIIEVGAALKEKFNNLNFAYLPTTIKEGKPKYTYQLEDGITTDRQGMKIIENEGILELIHAGMQSAESVSHKKK